MQKLTLSILLAVVSASVVQAQDSSIVAPTLTDTARHSQRWFTRHDAILVGVSGLVIGAISLADESVAKASQRPSIHSSATFTRLTETIQSAGDPGALLISSGLYVVGKATHHPRLARASKHSLIAIAVSSVITQSLKLSTGRARPNLTDDENAYVFHMFRGAKTDYNSFPSGHTTAVFAAAGVFSAEIASSHPKAARVVRPALFGLAALVASSRIYNNRHWLSDVAAGALIGEATARRVERITHDEQ